MYPVPPSCNSFCYYHHPAVRSFLKRVRKKIMTHYKGWKTFITFNRIHKWNGSQNKKQTYEIARKPTKAVLSKQQTIYMCFGCSSYRFKVVSHLGHREWWRMLVQSHFTSKLTFENFHFAFPVKYISTSTILPTLLWTRVILLGCISVIQINLAFRRRFRPR